MTIFGVDLASYQAGENLAALTGIDFVLAKVTEGTSYVDPPYAGWRTAAQAAGKIFIPYHFLTQQDSAIAQAQHMAANIGDTRMPLMVDVEVEGNSRPTLTDVINFVDAAAAQGVQVKLVYLPQWYWTSIGSPSLTVLTVRGIGVISSSYPRSAALGAIATYSTDGGDSGSGWSTYGGIRPIIWQFTDDAPEDGQPNDVNAYQGTAAQLATFLGSSITTVDSPAPMDVPTLDMGSTGSYVTQLQGDLTAHGFPVTADGLFGPLTVDATRAFQAYAGITIDGIVGPATWAKLATPATGLDTSTPTLSEGATGSAVTRMQSYLEGGGYNPQGVDGNFGPNTKAAVLAFQNSASLVTDGVCGPDTWAALLR